MSVSENTRSLFQCFQSLLTLIFVSICLFVLSILTFLTLRKHLMPISQLVLPVSFGLPSSFDMKTSPTYLVSSINLSDPIYQNTPLDLSDHPYRIEFICNSPRSYTNHQLGSFFVQLILSSTTKELIREQSRLILFPYQSNLVRLIRTLMFLPLSIFHIDYDRWVFKEVLIERLVDSNPSKRFLEFIQLNIIPPAFQLDQCSIHFYILDLTGFVYFFLNYPIITGCLSIFVLFSTYMTFYLIITGLTMLNQMTKIKKKE